MSKAREFWIEFPDNYPNSHEKWAHVDDIPAANSIHVREVVPIDWEKVWQRYWQEDRDLIEHLNEKLIQQLIEKQLSSKEVAGEE